MTKATFIKEIYLGLAYTFRGSVHYHYGRKHGSMQADMIQEELRVLYLDPTTARKGLLPRQLEESLKAHAYSNTLPLTGLYLLQ